MNPPIPVSRDTTQQLALRDKLVWLLSKKNKDSQLFPQNKNLLTHCSPWTMSATSWKKKFLMHINETSLWSEQKILVLCTRLVRQIVFKSTSPNDNGLVHKNCVVWTSESTLNGSYWTYVYNLKSQQYADIWGLFYLHGLTWISAWISNYIHYNVWDEITYPFLNFNGATVEV